MQTIKKQPGNDRVAELRGNVIAPYGYRAKRLWCGLVRCFFRSLTNTLVGGLLDRCARMLLLVRNGHMSGVLVVCIGRLCATCIELSSRTPLHYLPLLSSTSGGAIGILCCVPD